MKNYLKYSGLCAAALLLSGGAQAQTSINFETQNYKKLGVYDTWEQSPFRTGALEGNVAVVDNFLADEETNASAKMLGIQRSRFGSNTFGVRIDLNEVIETSPTVQYAHVLMHKPVEGRVMLIGLGKRTDRPEQSAEVEQFWSYPVSDMETDEWFDAVFPVKTNGGVEIHSLVIVPHCEAPHKLTEDFVVYIDEIEFTDDISPRIGVGNYPVNFPKDSEWGREDRKINGVRLTSADGEQTITVSDEERKPFLEKFETPIWAKAGETVTPTFLYTGEWVHGYVYIDRDNDGDFSWGVLSGDYLDTTTDLVAYSLYRSAASGSAKNSAGTTIYDSGNNFGTKLNPPAFTIPAELKPGMYRMRYKVDWNCIDPMGNIAAGNNILDNGGCMVDVMLNVHGDNCTVHNDNRNGEVVSAADGESLDGYVVPFGQDFTVKMVPSNGFAYNGIRVRHGYNLTGDSLVNSNPQFRDDYFFLDAFDLESHTCVIPGRCIDGDVLIEGLFVENGQQATVKKVTYRIVLDGEEIDTQEFTVVAGSPYPEPTLVTETSPAFYSITGYPEGETTDVDEDITLTVVQTLPFEVSRDHENATWYNMTIGEAKYVLQHSASLSYISLSSTAVPAVSDHTAQWAFVGNVFTGFQIINRSAGEGMVLSSTTNTSDSNTGGSTYPVMVSTPVPSTHNTHWIPTVSSHVGVDGFFLHQLGYPENRMNNRSNRLAYWTGGADAGSTFLVTQADVTTHIETSATEETDAPVELYNLQGVRVDADTRVPGIYIRRQGSRVEKIQIIR